MHHTPNRSLCTRQPIARTLLTLALVVMLVPALSARAEDAAVQEDDIPTRIAAISPTEVVFVDGYSLPLAKNAVIVNDIEGKRELAPAQVLPAWAVVKTAQGSTHPLEVISIRLIEQAGEIRE